jgi:hypothetical protein
LVLLGQVRALWKMAPSISKRPNISRRKDSLDASSRLMNSSMLVRAIHSSGSPPSYGAKAQELQ